jgi:hypothetical protein
MTDDRPEHTLDRAVLRMNAGNWGLTLGLLSGATLFASTNVLLLRGGDPVGPHLGLLGVYFPGYSVTFVGSLIGFGYAAVAGYVVGWTVGKVYNKLVELGA